MKHVLILFISLSINSFSQNNSFPNTFVGEWSGNLEIMGVDSTSMNVQMSLSIEVTENDSIYKWETTYVLSDSIQDTRSYELVLVDKSTGHYVIDEKNSIVMDAYYKNNTLTSFFSVMESFILFSYTLEGNSMVVDVFSAPTKSVGITGGNEIDGEEIPEVNSFKIIGRQRAVLAKEID